MKRTALRLCIIFTAFALLASACGSITDSIAIEGIDTTVPAVTVPPTAVPSTGVPTTLGTTPPVAATTPPPPATTALPATTAPTTTAAPVQDPAVASRLAQYTAWTVPTAHTSDDRALGADSWSETDAESETKTSVSCGPRDHPQLSKTFQQFPAFGFSGPVVPGLVVEGGGVDGGDLRVLPLDRSALTLTSSLASENPNRVLDSPESSSLSAAVAELKRDGDSRITNLDVVPSDISYVRTESHSFEQSSLDMDVSMRYSGKLASAGMDAAFSQESSVEKHTIAVRLIQPMYTIRAATDGFANPGDYFAETTSAAQVDQLIAAGSIGPSSAPMIIDEVTYGRVMYFTMTSIDSTSATDMWSAIEASRSNVSGEASLTVEQQKILSTSQISLLAFGGDQNDALTAIKTGDLGLFFNAANTAQAAELSFSLRTLSGDPVAVSDTADVQEILCDRSPVPYSFTAKVTGVNGRVRLLVNDTQIADVRSTPNDLFTFGNEFELGSEDIGGTRINERFQTTGNTIEIKYLNPDCINAQFHIEIVVDGVSTINEGRSKVPVGYCGTTWIYDVDPLTGSVTKRA